MAMSSNDDAATDTSNQQNETKTAAHNEDEKSKPATYSSVSYFQLYKYSTAVDKLYIVVGTIVCTLGAIAHTVSSLIFGNITNVIVNYVTAISNSTSITEVNEAEEIMLHGLYSFVTINTLLGVVMLICSYLMTILFSYSALNQTYKIRDLFLRKILNQDIAWYDVHQTGDFASRIADDLKKIEEGIGEKVSITMYQLVICASSILQGIILGWELALICLVSFPATTLSLGLISWISAKLAKQEMNSYAEASATAEEALSAIRTVVAFGGQKKEEDRYDRLLKFACKNNIKRLLFNGINNGVLWFFMYASYSLGFWYGVKLIIEDRELPPEEVIYDPGNMVAIFFSILTGTWFFSTSSPYIETFGIAKGAATKIFGVIDSEPVINKFKGKGNRYKQISGKISFKNVHFNYPSRQNVKVLQGLNLTISPGETVALVGSSGCGKSTCIQLIQRYYDPDQGEIYIDDHKITDLDLTWMRNHIGVVGQEPVLFEATIAENIKLGCKHASPADVERAAKKANADSFIKLLPQGYDTLVGERGAQLSGGQKQRIAIARALVREPSILLLDEATSALDTNSEAVVQAALDAASNECTTIIVAHRLSTVKNADRIIVISSGTVQEEGTHEDLMKKKGAYFELVTTQVSSGDADFEYTSEDELQFDHKIPFNTQNSIEPPITIQSEVVEEKEETSKTYMRKVMKYNSPEWWAITIGCISSVVAGAGIPIYAIIFGDVLGLLSDSDTVYMQEQTNTYAIYFLILGIIAGVSTFFQTYMFGIAGEKLTMRLRSLMFKSLLTQEIGYFDDKDHGVGSLCANLSGEPANVQGATGQRIGTILNSLATTIIALATTFYYEWRIALVSMGFSPLTIFSFCLQQKMIAKESQGHYESLKKSTKIAVEAMNGIRTVASLGCEDIFHELYMAEIEPYQKLAKRNSHFRGIVYGVSRSIMSFSTSASFYYGTMLIKNEGVDYNKVFIVSESIMMSSWSLANALAFTPNFQKGLLAANRILTVLNRTPAIRDGTLNADENWRQGNITYENVHFSYPSRSSVNVLKGLNMTVLEGKMVALVGPSGCGKSTIVQLLERFYDPTHGRVSVDGKGIDGIQLATLRSHLGIVSQEPNLFSWSIAENIAYGDNTRNVTKEEIITAAKNANIHNFISSLPLGYDTKLGEKGTQLSGGQKQRVAIARALVRNPKVLLLDEATSALDAESEKVVQEALDNAKQGRTCITIAHRLTTVQDADLICVINQGKVAEMGTHTQLLNLKGIYYKLYKLQH